MRGQIRPGENATQYAIRLAKARLVLDAAINPNAATITAVEALGLAAHSNPGGFGLAWAPPGGRLAAADAAAALIADKASALSPGITMIDVLDACYARAGESDFTADACCQIASARACFPRQPVH